MTHDDLTDDTPTTFPWRWLIPVGALAFLIAFGQVVPDPGDKTAPGCASPGAGVTVPGSLAQVEPGAVCSHGGGS